MYNNIIMSELLHELSKINTSVSVSKSLLVDGIERRMTDYGYTVVDRNDQKPWGAYLRFSNDEADSFVEEFFPELTPSEARLGNKGAELSPKILIVSPNQRLSWQYHNLRAERWAFLTDGLYDKSMTDQEEGVQTVRAGETVQFAAEERHRLIGRAAAYTLVTEIWKHLDSNNLSSEDDVVRLADDYSR